MSDRGFDITDDDGWLAAIGGRAAGADRGCHDLSEDIAAMQRDGVV